MIKSMKLWKVQIQNIIVLMERNTIKQSIIAAKKWE